MDIKARYTFRIGSSTNILCTSELNEIKTIFSKTENAYFKIGGHVEIDGNTLNVDDISIFHSVEATDTPSHCTGNSEIHLNILIDLSHI